MIRRADAIRFDSVVDVGRTRPLRVTAECVNEEIEVYLKVSARPQMGTEGLANEVIAACLAADLNLPINEPLLIDMSPEWIASVPDVEIRQLLINSSPVAFGSIAAGKQWSGWSSTNTLSLTQIDLALRILAFDAFITNDDRRIDNPNLLVKGDSFRIIDHELAFRIATKFFPPPKPWLAGNLSNLMGDDGHIFARQLRGRAGLDMASIKAAWQLITDDRIAAYNSCLPPEWADAYEPCQKALTLIGQVRDRIDECLIELGRVLQ
jgi:hypothetical protein